MLVALLPKKRIVACMRSWLVFVLVWFSFALGASPAAHAQDYVAAPSMAVNLEGISDWTTQQPFINVRLTARPWLGHLDGQWGGISHEQLRVAGHVNDAGWPVSIPPNATKVESLILTNQPTGFRSIRGRYRLTYSGDVDLRVTGTAREISRSEGEIWFEFGPSATGPIGIALTRINPEDPLTKLDIVHEDHVLAHEVGAMFSPRWIELIRDFRVLRFMNWMGTNNSPVSKWDELAKVGDYTYVDAVPLDVLLELANFTGADPWFTLPHMADDDLVARFAERVDAKLRSGLRAYFEYSNEIWNFQFQQTHWAAEQASALWGRRAGNDAWIQYAGLRAAEIAQIIDAQLGADADQRAINVIGVHTGWTELAEVQLEGRLLRRDWDIPPSEVFDALAVTGYLEADSYRQDLTENIAKWFEEGGEQAVFDTLADDIRNTRLRNLRHDIWPAHARTAQKHGFDLIMYEGGPHVIIPYDQDYDQDIGDLLTDFSYSPQMVTLYQDMFRDWRAAGGQLFNAFVDVSNPSRFGSWGLLRHLDDTNGRWQAVLSENTQPSGLNAERGEFDFAHGIQIVGASNPTGSTFDDILIAGPDDDTISPNGGSDRIHGFDGFDQVVLDGALDTYSFEFEDEILIISNGSDTSRAAGVEFLFFPQEGFGLFVDDLHR